MHHLSLLAILTATLGRGTTAQLQPIRRSLPACPSHLAGVFELWADGAVPVAGADGRYQCSYHTPKQDENPDALVVGVGQCVYDVVDGTATLSTDPDSAVSHAECPSSVQLS